jgi:hypothetical protein
MRKVIRPLLMAGARGRASARWSRTRARAWHLFLGGRRGRRRAAGVNLAIVLGAMLTLRALLALARGLALPWPGARNIPCTSSSPFCDCRWPTFSWPGHQWLSGWESRNRGW